MTMTEHPQAHLIPPLKVADRCCRCGAQAFVAVLLSTANQHALHFCGHHYTKHELALMGALAIRDERHLINTEPSPSANATTG